MPRRTTLLADIDVHEGRYADVEARCREVLGCAPDQKLANRYFVGCVELIAVRFEAAHRSGRPKDAGTLTEQDLERLRNLGCGSWATI